jgi:hypothetical protein
MLGEGVIIGILLLVAAIGLKLIFTTGNKWITGMFAFMVVVILIKGLT